MRRTTKGLVSVAIPVYNCAQYVSEAIDSVLAQTYRAFEIIVVDDGSTDATSQILAGYDARVRVIRQANQGRSAARNAGVRAARGEYLAFLDADDVWLPEKLERQVAVLASDPEAGWVYSDYSWLEAQHRRARSRFQVLGLLAPPEGCILADFVDSHLALVITILVRATCFAEIGGFDPALAVAEDTDLLMRLAASFPARGVNDVLALYRQHPAQVTRALPPGKCRIYRHCYWHAYAKFLRQPQPRVPRQVQRRVRGILYERSAKLACRLARDDLATRRPWRALLWWARAANCLRRTPSHGLGVLAEAVLPEPAARAARWAWRRIGARGPVVMEEDQRS